MVKDAQSVISCINLLFPVAFSCNCCTYCPQGVQICFERRMKAIRTLQQMPLYVAQPERGCQASQSSATANCSLGV